MMTGTRVFVRCRRGEQLANGQKIEGNGSDDDQNGGNPPDRFHSGRLEGGPELPADKFIVIKIFVGQVQPIVGVRVLTPAGIVIGAALGTG